jgi:hypothetical protein
MQMKDKRAGQLSLAAAMSVTRSGRVIAIEAHPRTCKYLQGNFRLNDLTIEIHNTAIGSTHGELFFTDFRSGTRRPPPERYAAQQRTDTVGPWTCMGRLVSRLFIIGPSPCSAGLRHLLVPTCFRQAAARSGGQGWPKAIAERLALDGREHSGRLARSGWQLRRYRGELAIVRADRAPRTCIRQTREGRNHDAVMRIGGEAPRRRAHSKPRYKDHSPTSGCRHLGPSAAARHR